jgi:hypothetical protein
LVRYPPDRAGTIRPRKFSNLHTRFAVMNSSDPVISFEIQEIKKIISDEMWLEGERRGCPVLPDDVVVRERVCAIVLRIGQQMRDSFARTTTTAI